MHDDDINTLVTSYYRKGIIVDTCILLLFLIGKIDRELIPDSDLLRNYTPDDFDLLNKTLKNFHIIATTPNILTEVYRHLRNYEKFTSTFSNYIKTTDEYYAKSKNIIDSDIFNVHGIADASLIHAAKKNNYLILTHDHDLIEDAKKENQKVINFYHLYSVV